jgi:hypothetical protein
MPKNSPSIIMDSGEPDENTQAPEMVLGSAVADTPAGSPVISSQTGNKEDMFELIRARRKERQVRAYSSARLQRNWR